MIILYFGWHYIFFFFAIPGIILPILWLMFVPDNPADSRFCSRSEIEHINSTKPAAVVGKGAEHTNREVSSRSFKWLDILIRARRMKPIDETRNLLSAWTLWGVALGYFFVQGIIGVILAWLPTYLTTVKKFSIMNVGFVAAAPFVGAVTGNILGGWLSDRFFGKRRKPTMIISTVSTIAMMYLLVYAPNDPATLAVILFLTGTLLSLGYSAFGIYPSGMTTKKVFPVATALINTGGQLGGAAIPFAVGVVLDRASWDAVFLFLSCCSLVALLLLLSVVEPLDQETIARA